MKSHQADSHDRRQTGRQAGRRISVLTLCVGISGTLLLSVQGVWPQESAAQQAAMRFQVPAGPLAQVLQQIASQARVLVSFDPVVVRGLESNGLQGQYRPHAAFDHVLLTHGLTIQEDTPGSFRVLGSRAQVVHSLSANRVEADAMLAPVLAATTLKRSTPLAQTTQSISVVSAEQMQRLGARNVTQALQYMPGVQVDNFGGVEVRNDWVVLRGFDAKLTGDYRDGLSQLPYDQIRARLPAYALEGITVLRGPVSALYGQAAPGGLVNRVTKRPPATALREIALQLGQYDYRQAYVDLGGPLQAESGLRFRLTATARQAGTQESYQEGRRYHDNLAYVAPAFSWQDAQTSVTVLMHHQRDRNDGESRAYYPSRILVGDPDYDRNERTVQSVAYLFEHKLNDEWRLRQNLRYQQGKMDLRNLYAGALAADGHTLSRTQLQAKERSHGWAMDTQLEGRFFTGLVKHTVLAGLDMRRLSGHQHYRQALAPSLDLWDPVYGIDIAMPSDASSTIHLQQQARQWGLYLQNHAQIGGWRLNLGLRRDQYRDKTHDLLTATDLTARGHAYTWQAGAGYETRMGVMPYVAYSTSFLPQAGADYQGKPFEPTKAAQWELGLKYQDAQTDSLYTLAWYDLRQRHALIDDPDPTHVGFSVAAGKMRARGLEFEADVALEANWRLLAAYTFNEVKHVGGQTAWRGKTPIVTPRHMASLWISKTLVDDWGEWQLGLGIRHLGATYVDVANTMKNGSATLVDASLAYELPAWRLALDATNLFNRQTVVCRNTRSNCRYGVERTVLATLSYRF